MVAADWTFRAWTDLEYDGENMCRLSEKNEEVKELKRWEQRRNSNGAKGSEGCTNERRVNYVMGCLIDRHPAPLCLRTSTFNAVYNSASR